MRASYPGTFVVEGKPRCPRLRGMDSPACRQLFPALGSRLAFAREWSQLLHHQQKKLTSNRCGRKLIYNPALQGIRDQLDLH